MVKYIAIDFSWPVKSDTVARGWKPQRRFSAAVLARHSAAQMNLTTGFTLRANAVSIIKI